MWKRVDDYCWTNGEYNICKIGSISGYSYEVWHVTTRTQLFVGVPTSKSALVAAREHKTLSTHDTLTQANVACRDHMHANCGQEQL